MKEIYHFRVELKGHTKTPILNIKPAVYGRKRNLFSNSFKELNVPIEVNDSPVGFLIEDGFDLEYRLDFEKTFTEKTKNYNIFNKRNLNRVLTDLNKTIDKDLRDALCFKKQLKKEG